jgi:hypothetical protein
MPRRAHTHLERIRMVRRLRAADGARRRTARSGQPGNPRRPMDLIPAAGAPRGDGKNGAQVDFTYEANPGEVWEENEWWIQLSARNGPRWRAWVCANISKARTAMAKSSPLMNITVAVRKRRSRPCRKLLKKKDLTPLEYMRKYGAFEVTKANYTPTKKN